MVLGGNILEKITSPHDHFFRAAMSEQRVAKAFFTQYLPESTRNIVDLNTLQLRKESFIDPQLKLSVTDMLFSANFAGKPGYIYLLTEHRSTANRWQPFTMLRYIIQIMEQHRKETKAKYLPLVYPIVFYNGQTRYPYSTDILDLFDQPRELVHELLFQPFQLIDLNAIPDEDLKTNTWLSIMTIIMKHIYARDILPYIEGLAGVWREVEQDGGDNYIEAAFNYLLTTSETPNPETLVKVAQENLSYNLRETVMTVAQQLEERGRQRGLKAIAIKLLQKNMSVTQVAQLTELPLDLVKALAKEKNHSDVST